MPKRNLRIVTQDVPIIGICEACNTQFKSFDVNEAERAVKAQFDAHKCKPLDASQNAVPIVREATEPAERKELAPKATLARWLHKTIQVLKSKAS
jgi:hypothetical protein